MSREPALGFSLAILQQCSGAQHLCRALALGFHPSHTYVQLQGMGGHVQEGGQASSPRHAHTLQTHGYPSRHT